jgi:hypothetical protein
MTGSTVQISAARRRSARNEGVSGMTKPHHIFPLIPSRLPLMALSAEWPSVERVYFLSIQRKINPYLSVGYMMGGGIKRYTR